MLMDYRTQLFPLSLFALYKFKNRFKNTLIVNEKKLLWKALRLANVWTFKKHVSDLMFPFEALLLYQPLFNVPQICTLILMKLSVYINGSW